MTAIPSAQPQEPVAYVPVHPRAGPLWANTTADPNPERLPSYPLMPLYTPAPAAPSPAQPIAAIPNLRARLGEAHDASLDDDHRACRAILMECIRLLDAAPAATQLPVAWLRNFTDPQPHAVTNLNYRAASDAARGVEYLPVYAGPATQPEGQEAWQPIETAPKNAEEILCLNRSGRVRIETGHFMHRLMHAAKVDEEECFYTHWQPLPAPPAAQAGDGKP